MEGPSQPAAEGRQRRLVVRGNQARAVARFTAWDKRRAQLAKRAASARRHVTG